MHSVMPPRNNRKTLHYPFLEQLTYDAVKRAYRANMLAHHPDHHQDKKPDELGFFARHIEAVNRSYEYLAALFGEKKSTLPTPEETKRRRIIAVGGAKGGIGKSMFAANLGMMLSAMGHKTVLVDLDLGGSNLHIYLGLSSIPETTVSDFLERKVASLSEVAIAFADGPTLIAGNTGELGAANIPFQKKMRLIEKIQEISADYVILDLGGGTDFNTLDFFLASDIGIVLSTLDQPAYVEAYAFIKTALQRKLNRLFGADSTFPAKENAALKELITEGTRAAAKESPRTIQNLLEKVARATPAHLPLITDEILNFTPHLIINNCFDPAKGLKVVSSLRSVACRRLSIDINHVGIISKHAIIERSTSYLDHPVVARHKTSKFAAEMKAVITALDLAPEPRGAN